MTGKRKVLDLFCKAGGAGYGYYLAGCDVIGVDIEHQPRYPFEFIQADAIGILQDISYLRSFDLIHASPPCQSYSVAAAAFRANGKEYADLVPVVRSLLENSGAPYVIENVEGAPLIDPVMLCGTMFGLKLYRHRLFECSFPLARPDHPAHLWNADKVKWDRSPDHILPSMRIDANERSRQAMGIEWMTGAELRQAIPPAFTRYIAESDGTRQCVICQKWWSPKRSHAKTCSPRCRQALSRFQRESVTIA